MTDEPNRAMEITEEVLQALSGDLSGSISTTKLGIAQPIIEAALAERDAEFQTGVGKWMDACFGAEISEDQLERGDRFIEEALELAQTVPGFNAARAHALVDYVFGRPVGEPLQEVGGVMVTLAALCNTFDLSIADSAQTELARVWTKVDAIRAKQAAKPTGSALPIAYPASEQADRIRQLEEALAALEPFFDAIICFASTQGAYEPNRIAAKARALLKHEGN